MNHQKFSSRYMPNSQYTVSTNTARFDVEMIYRFLTNCYWAEGVTREIVLRSIENAVCFGVFDGDKQVGFARVITDRATYAYIGDVFILESHRGRGLSKLLMTAVMEHPELQGFRRWSLVTNDAHGLYQQFGFKPPANPQRYMEIINPAVYKDMRR
jgi:GNAT superfamily N-acetyltransferase